MPLTSDAGTRARNAITAGMKTTITTTELQASAE
jgi:hypothetical protein